MIQNSALVLVDVQVNMWMDGEWELYNKSAVLDTLEHLLQRARNEGVPIIYIQNNGGVGEPDEPGTEGWQIHPRLAPVDSDIVVQKTVPSAFEENELDRLLKDRGIERLVVAGVQTDVCVNANCEAALSHDYDVVLVRDAHTTFDGDDLTAPEIVDKYNESLASMLSVKNAADITF